MLTKKLIVGLFLGTIKAQEEAAASGCYSNEECGDGESCATMTMEGFSQDQCVESILCGEEMEVEGGAMRFDCMGGEGTSDEKAPEDDMQRCWSTYDCQGEQICGWIDYNGIEKPPQEYLMSDDFRNQMMMYAEMYEVDPERIFNEPEDVNNIQDWEWQNFMSRLTDASREAHAYCADTKHCWDEESAQEAMGSNYIPGMNVFCDYGDEAAEASGSDDWDSDSDSSSSSDEGVDAQEYWNRYARMDYSQFRDGYHHADPSVTDEQVRDTFLYADKNRDFQLQYHEFERIVALKEGPPGDMWESMEWYWQHFAHYPERGMSIEEFHEGSMIENPDMSWEELEGYFYELDHNDNGYLSQDEFMSMMYMEEDHGDWDEHPDWDEEDWGDDEDWGEDDMSDDDKAAYYWDVYSEEGYLSRDAFHKGMWEEYGSDWEEMDPEEIGGMINGVFDWADEDGDGQLSGEEYWSANERGWEGDR